MREELKSDHRDTEVDAIEQRPGFGLKVLVIGEQTLEPKTLELLRDQGLGVQTVTLDRFRLAAETYGPDTIVCSERCLRTGLREELSTSAIPYSVVVLQHERGTLAPGISDLPGPMVIVPAGEGPLQIAMHVRSAARRGRRRSEAPPKPPSAPTLPSGARGRDSSPPPSIPPAPRPATFYPPVPTDEPTHIYAARDFMASREFIAEELTPPSSYSMARHTSVTPNAPPTSVRLPLSSRGKHLNGVRVALVDVDPTRTDALAVALRARKAEVHIASINADRAHFRLLRRFAPHALLLDEEVLANEGKEFFRQFREDPFLQHTQLLTVRFERLFRIRSGTASIESIKDLLEPLGRAETDLLSQLGPGVEVEFDLDQFPPHRLIKMLARRSAPTTISCTREKETFQWTVANGKTGRASLTHSAHKDPCVLSPDEAFDWLLSHQNCHVVLLEPTDYDDTTGRSVIPLVENKESGLWQLPMWAPSQVPLRKRIRHGSQPDSLGPVSVRPRPITSRLLLENVLGGARTKWAARIGGASLALGAVLGLAYVSGQNSNKAASQTADESQIDADAQLPPEPEAGAKTSRPEPQNLAGQVPGTEAAPLDMDAPASQKGSDPESLFLVASMEDIPCETIVGSWKKPPTAHLGLANMHFRAAQKLLVEGRSDAAHVELCKSALLNASGPGSELLAQFSLGARSTLQAERWIREVLKAQPESPVARELLGDILHQQGRLDEALVTWLDTLKVAAEDMAKRKAVARVWIGHSRAALAATDYPRAERSLRRALAFDPNSIEAASLMAIVFQRRNNDDRAAAWEAEAARLRGAR